MGVQGPVDVRALCYETVHRPRSRWISYSLGNNKDSTWFSFPSSGNKRARVRVGSRFIESDSQEQFGGRKTSTVCHSKLEFALEYFRKYTIIASSRYNILMFLLFAFYGR